jgi:hypothetical protein
VPLFGDYMALINSRPPIRLLRTASSGPRHCMARCVARCFPSGSWLARH